MTINKKFRRLRLLFAISCFLMLWSNPSELFSLSKNRDPNHLSIKLAQQGIFQYKEILNIKPPFYNGQMPLVIISNKKFIGQREMITVSQNYGKFENIFRYNDVAMKYSGIADEAQTNDLTGRLIAEAKLVNLIKGVGIHIEERHYGIDGKEIFRCISLIKFNNGFKTEEKTLKGKKQRDYYFIWPVRAF